MKRYVRACAVAGVVLLAYGMCSPALAGLVWYADAVVNGTGVGAVPVILDFPGNSPADASGCVKWTLSGNAYGGPCPETIYTFENDQDNGKSTTRTPGEISSTMSPFNLAIVFNPSEPGSNTDIWLNRMVLTFYDPNHPDTTWSSHQLGSGMLFPDGGSGSGSSGFVFGLDWGQAVALQSWVLANSLTFTDIRLGLGAEVGDQQGHTYFYLAQLAEDIPTPEPLSAGLVAAGLMVLVFLRRRRVKTP